MSEHKIHIGHTVLVFESRFGVQVLSVSEHGRPAQRVGTFDTPVAASHAVEAIKRGLAEDGIDWDEPRPRGTSVPDAVLESRAGLWDAAVDRAYRGMIMRQNADDVKRTNPLRVKS